MMKNPGIRSSKIFTAIVMSLVLALAMAVPAFADTHAIQFLNEDGTVSSHASSFIKDGVAEVTGSPGNYTVSITLNNVYPPFPAIPVSYDYLRVDLNGDGIYEVNAAKSASASETTFTFSGVDNVLDNLPILLYVNAGAIHNQEYRLFLDWM